MCDFQIDDGVLKKYLGSGGDVIIPDGITRIGKNAFSGCTKVTNIIVPDGVTAIDMSYYSQ